MKNFLKTRFKEIFSCIAVVVICCSSMYYLLWEFNPLPNDEEMIANFNAHRAEFEELVRRYRNYPRPPDKDISKWYREGDTQELMQRAGVARIDQHVPTWFPNPYSVASVKRFIEQIYNGQARKLGLFYKYGTLRVMPVPEPIPLIPGNTNRYNFISPFSPWRGVIWKDYCHIPEIPRIENGELLLPWSIVGKGARVPYQEIDGVPVSQKRVRIFPSLNRFPEQWKSYECVYRQIEPHWFLRMCNGH